MATTQVEFKDLPNEIVRIIASIPVIGAFSLLITCKQYLALLTPCDRYDHMINIGYTIQIKCDHLSWWKHNQLHNRYGPAWIDNVSIEYYIDGCQHREDGPAIIYADGVEEWMQNGDYHREDGPAIYSSRSEIWKSNGQLHRDSGPAIVLFKEDWKDICYCTPLGDVPNFNTRVRLWYHRGLFQRSESE